MSVHSSGHGADDGDEDSFNAAVDDYDDDGDDGMEPDDFDSEMKDDTLNASTASSSHALAFDSPVHRRDYEALDEAQLRAHMDALVADVAAVIDESKDKAALLLRTQRSCLSTSR